MHAGNDEVALKALLAHHDDDFFVIPSPPSPELADTISGEALGGLIARLATMFRYVIVDTTPGLGEHTLAALEHATDGVFVTNMTVPSLRALRKEFEMLVALGLVPTNRHMMLNFVEKNIGLLKKDAEAILGAQDRRRDSAFDGRRGRLERGRAHDPPRRARPCGEGISQRHPAHRPQRGSDTEAHPQEGEGPMSLSDRLERARGVHRAPITEIEHRDRPSATERPTSVVEALGRRRRRAAT